MDDSYVAIQGPPGTGKTFTGSRVIKELVEKHHWRIGVVAQSHAVVENMLGRHRRRPDSTRRWSPRATTRERRPRPGRHCKNVPKFLDDHLATGCVLGGTAWDFANENTIARGGLDLLVIDEAGQFSLAPTIGASVAAKRLLLLGDPQQLPQVSQGTHAEPVDESALGWLMDGHDTIPGELGYFLGRVVPHAPGPVREGLDPVLRRTPQGGVGRRMREPRRASSRGSTSSASTTPGTAPSRRRGRGGRRRKSGRTSGRSGSTRRTPRRHDRSSQSTSWSSPPTTPRSRSSGRTRQALASRVYASAPSTSSKGQEAPIAIVSMTASSHGDVPRGMGFLLSRNRVNVAVSRAKWRAVLIRSETLTSFMPASVQGVLELGAFIGLCQSEIRPELA